MKRMEGKALSDGKGREGRNNGERDGIFFLVKISFRPYRDE